MVEDQTSFIHAPPLHQPLFSAILMTNNTDNITLLDVRQFGMHKKDENYGCSFRHGVLTSNEIV